MNEREAATHNGVKNGWATVVIMVIAVVAVTVGDLFMSYAMKSLGPLKIESLPKWRAGQVPFSMVVGEIYRLGWAIFSQPYVWIAIAFMLTFLVLWMVALSWSELTFVMPLTALTYVLNAILVGPALGETVSPVRWLGTMLIALGVALVGVDASGKQEETGRINSSSH